jgi:phosphoserine phosphatase
VSEDKDLLMVVVSGHDRQGITATFSRILYENGVEVLDIEQGSLQNLLGLYLVLDLTHAEGTADSVIKDLLFEASKLKVTLNFRIFSPGEMEVMNQLLAFIRTYP